VPADEKVRLKGSRVSLNYRGDKRPFYFSKGKTMKLCLSCGSSPGVQPVYADAARELGHVLVTAGIDLVYGVRG
jgi:hypothetical protein